VLFGLIMVLTFTGSLSIAEAGREDIRVMLVGALGCNIAWGIIDGVLYLMGCLAERGRNLTVYRALRETGDPISAQQLMAGALPPIIASVMEPSELESMRRRLQALPDPPNRPRLTTRDWLGALGVFFFVFATTFPVAIPFLVMTRAHLALRVSNAIAVAMLFICGYAFGRITHAGAWIMGIAMVILGIALVALTIALGG
jgi:VIT1/CCC1 family predicted Fe2+/Mn2+ transporter